MHALSIYDMDKTITRKATFVPFLLYAVPRYKWWRVLLLPAVALAGLAYVAKLITRARLKEINFRLMLGSRIDAERFGRIAEGFAGKTLASNTLRGALDQIATDKAEGRRVVIATASYALYVRAYAAVLGVSDVIATRTRQIEMHHSPKIDGENCFGDWKFAMVKDWLAAEGITRDGAHVRFYSDHVSDEPCLAWADEAYVTNPHPPLLRMARERGWHVLLWR